MQVFDLQKKSIKYFSIDIAYFDINIDSVFEKFDFLNNTC